MLGNTYCRKIGELKNGEEKTFQIDDRAAKVYVIFDTLSKGYCNEFYQLPEGQEDIRLTGKCKFNLFAGNAFRFDNNDNPAARENIKRTTRRGVPIIIISVIVGVAVGLLVTSCQLKSNSTEPKTFTSDGMRITLTEAFRKTRKENFTAVFDSKNVAVFVLKEEFSLLEGLEDYTLAQYGDIVIRNNGHEDSKIETADGLTYFEYTYTDPDSRDLYRYRAYIYKAEDAFWLVQFAFQDENAKTLAPQLLQWAKSVEFTD